MAHPTPRPSRGLPRLIGLIAVEALVVALVLEAAIRVVGPRTALHRLLYQPATAADLQAAESLEALMRRSMIGFAPRTASYGFVLNSRSLRTSEYTVAKPPGVTRVLAFGDSFTWASGALPHEDSWTVVLEDRLRRAGVRAEVLRLGVPGTGPDFQHRLWQLEGSRLGADLVVLGFFVGNDFVEHQPTDLTRGLRPHALTEVLADDWMTFRLARNLYRVARDVVVRPGGATERTVYPSGGYPLPEYARDFRPELPTFTAARHLKIEASRMALCLDDSRGDFEALLARVAATIAELDREVRAAGARFVVVLFPDEYRVDPRVAGDAAAVAGRDLDDYDLDRPARRLAEVLGGRGIEVVDLTPLFVERGRDLPLYRVRDTHWNRAGNELAGDVIANFLTTGEARPSAPPDPARISVNDFERGDPEAFRSPAPVPGTPSDCTAPTDRVP
ncbi:MAG: GDSL-type esterase/lipase family protein [Thermoanaerobaculales bacterium]|jgi:hypothetical protein|nr:GDSL-type esterase/lipase family protein [Thermoanaerobaculales bacterium]